MPRRLLAAAFAVLAEAGLAFLIVAEVSVEGANASSGPLLSYPVFAVLFVGAVLVGTRLRSIRAFAAGALAVGIGLALLQGLAWGHGDVLGVSLLIVVMAFAAARTVTLVRRDWSEPVEGSFLGGAAVLLLEVALAPSATRLWQRLIPFVVVLFFVGSLASRAVSMTVLERSRKDAAPVRRARDDLPAPVAFLAVLVALMGFAALLGGSHGLLQRLGGPVYDVAVLIIVGSGWVLARILYVPAYGIFHLLHINLAGLRALAERLQDLAVHPARGRGSGKDWLVRLAGFAFLAGVGYLLARTTRRWLLQLQREHTPTHKQAAVEEAAAALAPTISSRRSFLRRELPADVIRRWYAEALVALEGRGLARPPGATPAEYLADVARAFPTNSAAFAQLTRAYEDVRYGSLTVDRVVVRRLNQGRASMMESFRRDEPVAPATA
jgi:uncharacterized protein DUF4129